MNRFLELHHINAFHYVIRIFFGALIIEFALPQIGINPLWALVSLIVITDPQIKTAWTTFTARFINTIIGSMIGIIILTIFGFHAGYMTLGILISALCSSMLARLQQGWRIGPITTALVMSAGFSAASAHEALVLAWQRTASVLLGSVIALAITVILSRFWMPPLPSNIQQEIPDKPKSD